LWQQHSSFFLVFYDAPPVQTLQYRLTSCSCNTCTIRNDPCHNSASSHEPRSPAGTPALSTLKKLFL
jgi:hypothetical protein